MNMEPQRPQRAQRQTSAPLFILGALTPRNSGRADSLPALGLYFSLLPFPNHSSIFLRRIFSTYPPQPQHVTPYSPPKKILENTGIFAYPLFFNNFADHSLRALRILRGLPLSSCVTGMWRPTRN